MEDFQIQQHRGDEQFSRKRFFSMLLGLNIIVGLIFALGIYTIIKKDTKVSILAEELEIEAKKDRVLSLMKETLEDTTLERAKLDSYFIENEDIVTLLEEIEILGEVAGVDLSFESVVVDTDVEAALNLQIVTIGSFKDTYYILTLLEVLPVKISFGNISITKTLEKNKEKRGQWRGSFRVTILSYNK